MAFIQPLIDVGIFYATGRSPQMIEKDKLVRLNTIFEDFINSNNANKIESTMEQIIQEGYDPKCISKIYRILQVRPYSEIKGNAGNMNLISNQVNGILSTDLSFSNNESLDPSNRHRHRSPPWSTEEDERLIAGIFHYGFSDWQKVAAFVGKGRTRAQCGQRWLRCLDPNMNKEKWTIEEDATLKKLVELYGVHSWARIAKEIGSRTDVQCRYRYVRCSKEPPNFINNQSIPHYPNFPSNSIIPNSQQQLIQHIHQPENHLNQQQIKKNQTNLIPQSNDNNHLLVSSFEPNLIGENSFNIITDANSESQKDLTPFGYQNILPLAKPATNLKSNPTNQPK